MTIKRYLSFVIFGTILFTAAASAQDLKIVSFVHKKYVEVEAIADNTWHPVAELNELTLPVSATYKSADRKQSLLFEHNGEEYRVARPDVELSDEKIVVDGCNTVPSTLPKDSQSASVKGAGERCD